MLGLVKNLFDNTVRTLRRMERVVGEINALEPAISSLSDRDLAAKTD